MAGLLNKPKYPLRTAQNNGLLGGSADQYQSQPMRELANYPDYGMRHDNSAPKGLGYFGLLQTLSDSPYQPNVMSEYSFGTELNGKEQEIPSIVPPLVTQEIDWLLNGGKLTDEIKRKAYEHALIRGKMGLSPFSD